MKKAKELIKVTKSSGNVFADLSLPDPENALAKAKLASAICRVIEQRGLTQTQAAKLLGLDQPKISALVRGKLSGFSTDRLLRFLNDLGHEVAIIIRPAKPVGHRGDIRVVAAVR
jgi:predicted XRE-type DNA-binding protein